MRNLFGILQLPSHNLMHLVRDALSAFLRHANLVRNGKNIRQGSITPVVIDAGSKLSAGEYPKGIGAMMRAIRIVLYSLKHTI